MPETPTPQNSLQLEHMLATPSSGVGSGVGNKGSGLEELRSHRGQTLRLGSYQIDVGALKLIADQGGEVRRITPKTMSVLLELALRSGETIARDELLEAVWPNTCPTPEVLTQAIKELRKAFQDDQKAPNYIETVPKIGYRLLKNPIWSEVSERAMSTPNDAVHPITVKLDPQAQAVVPLLVRQPPALVATAARSIKRSLAISLLVVVLACGIVLGLRQVLAPKLEPRHAETTSDAANKMIAAANLANLAQIKKSYRLISSAPGAERTPVISSNGAWLAYVTQVGQHNRVWVRDLATASAQRLSTDNAQTLDSSEINPHFSVDGLEVAYVRFSPKSLASSTEVGAATARNENDKQEHCEIIAQRILGGSARKLMDCPDGMMLPFDWPTENELIFAQRQASENDAPVSMGIVSYQLDTGKNTVLVSGGAFNWQPKRAPDGTLLAFRQGVGSDSVLYISDGAGKNARPLAHLATASEGYAWLADSRSIVAAIASEGEYDLTLLREGQAPIPLGVLGQNPSVSKNGQVVFSVATEQIGLLEFGLTDARDGVRLFPSTGSDGPPSISPNGEWIAFLSSRGGIGQVWLGKRGLQPQAITQLPRSFGAISWHPSGAGFLFSTLAPGAQDSEILEFGLDRSRTRVVAVPPDLGLIIRANYDGDAVLVLSSHRGRRRLQKWQPNLEQNKTGDSAFLQLTNHSPERPWRLLWTLENIAGYRVDQSTSKLYFTRVGNKTLFERLSDGTEQARLEAFKPRGFWRWRVEQGLVYYVTDNAPASELRVFDLHAKTRLTQGADRKIRQIPAGDFALDLQRQTAIVPVSLNDEMDIGSLQLQ